MKKILLYFLLSITFLSNAQTLIKYKQMENPATSSVNLGTQTFSAGNATFSNVVAANLVTYNVKNYGMVGNGVADDRTALNTLLNTTAASGSVIYFPPGIYNIGSAITLSDKQFYFTSDFATLHSTFNGTMLDISSTSTVTVLGSKCEFHRLNFTGTATGNSQIGINFSSNSGNFKVIDCNFSNFGASGIGSGIEINSTQISTALGGLIKGCIFTSNFLAIYMNTRAEYLRIQHNYFTLNGTALYTISGNLIVTNNDISYNTNGITGFSGSNNGHGIFSDNNFNHNTNYTIRFEDTNFGNTFVGNHVYQGFVKFKNCTGFNITGGILDADNYEFDNNIGCVFNNVTFDSSYVNSTTLTTGVIPTYVNCIKLNGSIAKNPNTFIQSSRGSSATHIIGITPVPTIASGTGLGTGAGTVISVAGNDMCGIIGVVTGTASLGTTALLATVTFNVPYITNAPIVVLQPYNQATQDLIVGTQVVPSAGTTTFALTTNSVALTSGATYSWSYHILGR